MATTTLEATRTVYLIAGSDTSYELALGSVSAYWMRDQWTNVGTGQQKQSYTYRWKIYRGGIRFDLSAYPGIIISAAKLKLYGSNDGSDDDFDVTVCEVNFASIPNYYDYSNFQDTSFGSLTTVGMSVGGWNEIDINAAGLAYLNDAVSSGEVELGLRSSKDLSETAPTQDEYFSFSAYDSANIPALELTYTTWPSDEYPATPDFPLAGSIDLTTYSVISSYLTGLDADLSLTTDGDGNVDLAVDNYIWWTGTSEQVGYDDTNSRVTLTTLEATSAITIAADLVTADPSITTTGTAVDCTVANDALLSNTAYASIKAKVTDNEIGFDAIPSASPADDEGDIYMDITTGDLTLKTRDDGQAGSKTDILADFSAM